MKTVDLEGKKVRLQIVDKMIASGTQLDKIDSAPSLLPTTSKAIII